MPTLFQSLQALETVIATADESYLADGDYRIQRSLAAVCTAADTVPKGQLSDESMKSCLDRLAKAQEKLEERSRRFKRSRQDPPPEGKGFIEMARDRLRGLMADASSVGDGGEGRVVDAEMGEDEGDKEEIRN
ncbi:hypothetical protein G7Y79_00047g083670 [Physcia stellaris]|nr:hypothetical protein G7Y79_00047g083670 [Physcia stellaris]